MDWHRCAVLIEAAAAQVQIFADVDNATGFAQPLSPRFRFEPSGQTFAQLVPINIDVPDGVVAGLRHHGKLFTHHAGLPDVDAASQHAHAGGAHVHEPAAHGRDVHVN